MLWRTPAYRLDTGDRILIYNARRRAPITATVRQVLTFGDMTHVHTDRGVFRVPATQGIDMAPPARP
jgi:hypothetical protein